MQAIPNDTSAPAKSKIPKQQPNPTRFPPQPLVYQTHVDKAPPKQTPLCTFEDASLAGRLLDPRSNTTSGLRARLGVGLGGLALLGLLPSLMLEVTALPSAPEARFAAGTFWVASFPVTAVLTLVMPLPGLFILLSMQKAAPEWTSSVHALSRAIYRQGLLALGLVPILSLFALSGASHDSVSAATLAGYFVAGAAALVLLLRELWRALCQRNAQSGLLLLSWGGFVALLGLAVFTKLGGLS